ncbi:hypothetical protein [Nocardiopsis sp. TNDT3]|uniref:VG15 protein n=1 Tax=Nocardiopsis sp. TNDT3 TaxID=2249354 RepID=UPI000E3D6B2F|nr:hypothetical protein [Nocardiopsis sp. TNDT3]
MSTALARRHRTTQTALTSLLTLGMADLWRSLVDEQGPREAWPVLYPQMAAMVQDQRARSAEIGRQFYAQARAEAGVPGRPPTVEVPRAPAAQLETSLAVTGLTSYENGRRSGRSPDEALDVTIVTVTGAAERLVAEGGRKAITESARSDREALGWFRLPGPAPCWWCAMLASRGAVYGSRESASTTEDGERYHDHCACEPWPVFSRTEELPPEVQRWVDAWDASANTGDPIAAFRQKVAEANAADNDPERQPEDPATEGGSANGGSPPQGPPTPSDDDDDRPLIGDLIPTDEDDADERRADIEDAASQVIEGEYTGRDGTVFQVSIDSVSADEDEVVVQGQINVGGLAVGEVIREFMRDDQGNLWAHHDMLTLDAPYQGRGFASAFNAHLEDWYRQSGVERIELLAGLSAGGYVWATQGYDFLNEEEAEEVIERLEREVDRIEQWVEDHQDDDEVSDAEYERQEDLLAAALDVISRSGQRFGSDEYPSAYEISRLGYQPGMDRTDSWLGKLVLLAVSWRGVKYL